MKHHRVCERCAMNDNDCLYQLEGDVESCIDVVIDVQENGYEAS